MFSMQPQLARLADRQLVRGTTTRSVAARAAGERAIGLAIVLGDPVASTLSAWSSVVHMLLDLPDLFSSVGGWTRSLLSFLASLHASLEAAGLLLASWLAVRLRLRPPALLTTITAYMIVLSSGPEAYAYAARFRAPITPLLALLTAFAIDRLLSRAAQQRRNV